jgi:transcriptional regulator with XRE-family HTH domain
MGTKKPERHRRNPHKNRGPDGGAARLLRWLEKKSYSFGQLAEVVGVSKQHIWNIVRGDRLPSLALAARIEEATLNHVPSTSWSV